MVNPRGSQAFWQPKLLPFVAMAAMPADSRRRQARQPLAALKIMIVQTCPGDLLYTFSLCLCTLVCTNKEREKWGRGPSVCWYIVVVVVVVVVVVPSDPLLPHTVLCVSYFFLCFLLFFSPFSSRKKCRIFCAALLGGGFGVLGGWGFGWGGFRGGGGA